MADSILSIIIRDPTHPCAPYQRTKDSFWVQIFHCDGKPLVWKGVNFAHPFLLTERGAGGGHIHAQVKVPPGCYLVRAISWCKNIITDWAYVGVGCGQTVCLNLTIPTVWHCIQRAIVGLHLGTIDPPEGEKRVAEVMPKEVEEAVRLLRTIADRLPPDSPEFPAPPTEEEISKFLKK